jgi:hypothetical protein
VPDSEFFHVELTLARGLRGKEYGLNYSRSEIDTLVKRYDRGATLLLPAERSPLSFHKRDRRFEFDAVSRMRIASTPAETRFEQTPEDVFDEADIVAIYGKYVETMAWRAPEPPPPPPPQAGRTVFVSHASADRALVDGLTTMLQTAIGLGPHQLFYTSGRGTGVPPGKNFVEYIRDQIRSTTFVVAVITEAFRDSEFCLAELGAVWVSADKDFFPICVPPVQPSSLGAVLTGIQVANVEERSHLIELLTRVSKHFGREYNAPAGDAAVSRFVATLGGLGAPA